MYASIAVLLHESGSNGQCAEYLAKLLLEARPVGEVKLAVKDSCLCFTCRFDKYVIELVRIVSQIIGVFTRLQLPSQSSTSSLRRLAKSGRSAG